MKSQIFTVLIILFSSILNAQDKHDLQKLVPKRFIDKVEVVVGPSLLLNYGNEFIENDKGPYFSNSREVKTSFSFGLGIHHPLKNWLDIGVRLLWEKKGTKSKFTTAPQDTSATHNLVQSVESEYTYNYLTLSFTPTIFLDKKRRYALVVGGYYSQIKSVNAKTSWAWHNDNYNGFSKQSFHGRQVVGIDSNGGVTSLGTAPGLSSFQNDDYGAIIGLGCYIPLTRSHSISIQLIENFGLQNINKQAFGPSLSNPPEKNNTLCLMIGYVYHRPQKNVT
jgi:hypothetical protein